MDACVKCGIPMDDDSKCSCNPSLCFHCCACPPDCTCGCSNMIDELSDDEDDDDDDLDEDEEEGEGDENEEEKESDDEF